MLEVLNVSKTYPKGKRALKNISFHVNGGEIISLLGENGAGKTTLLKIIASFLLPDEGSVFINGIDSIQNPGVARENVSIATGQERSFYYRLSAVENLKFFGALNNLYGKKLMRKIEKIMKLVEIEQVKNIKYMKLSSGFKKRVDIARALLKDAYIYIFDEPTSGVDLKTKLKIHKIMKILKEQGKIVIFASHDLSDIKTADRVIVLKNGKKMKEESPNAFKDEKELIKILNSNDS